ncbi:MAG: UbiX family flavin prenyltransferase [Thermodesulfobacteriota bacterium]|nr:UbiX family flavin prenyltransferase [Thermodesulfobacteriota bacterium]
MKLVIGISGASGSIYGIRLLEFLKEKKDIETHLVMSSAGKKNIEIETDYDPVNVEKLADYLYDFNDIGADIASGSFRTDGMIIIPCSVKTLSALANAYNENLLVRAGDVTLKERKKLVVVFRETPLNFIHIKMLERLTLNGAIILPPTPAFYHRPKTMEDIINQTLGKVLDLFNIEHNLFKRWGNT